MANLLMRSFFRVSHFDYPENFNYASLPRLSNLKVPVLVQLGSLGETSLMLLLVKLLSKGSLRNLKWIHPVTRY